MEPSSSRPSVLTTTKDLVTFTFQLTLIPRRLSSNYSDCYYYSQSLQHYLRQQMLANTTAATASATVIHVYFTVISVVAVAAVSAAVALYLPRWLLRLLLLR